MFRIISAFLVTCMLLGTPVFAAGWGGASFMGGGDKKQGGATVDVKALTLREAKLKLKLNIASVTLAKGLVEVQMATGKAAEAEKLKAALEEAQKNPSDVEQTKKLCTELNNAGDSLKKLDLNASMNQSEARSRLSKSILMLGAAVLVDLTAVNDAKGLMTDLSNSINAVKASPATYGFSALKDLTSALNTAKFVAETVPSQLSTIAEISKGVIKYAQTNKIALPTDKEKEKLSNEMSKE